VEGTEIAPNLGSPGRIEIGGSAVVEGSHAVSPERFEPLSTHPSVPGGAGRAVPEASRGSSRPSPKSRRKAAVRPRHREEGGRVGDDDEEATSDPRR
jgi:hypothetical protein